MDANECTNVTQELRKSNNTDETQENLETKNLETIDFAKENQEFEINNISALSIIDDTKINCTSANCNDNVEEYVEADVCSSKENVECNCNSTEKILELEDIVLHQKKKLDVYENKLLESDQKQTQFKNMCMDLENRLQMIVRQCEAATKEKETMVMRYAVSEKSLLEQRAGRENLEKKIQEVVKEKDLLNHKLSAMVSEKNRICQMLDNKGYELKGVQQELDRSKTELLNLETKLKWSQNSLRTEIDLRKESNSRVEVLSNQLQEASNEVEKAKHEAQEYVKNFQQSQDNRAYVLSQELKEQQASLILEKHEREEKEQMISNLKSELNRLQNKHQSLIEENNRLSVKVQQQERERLENEQKLSELRCCADKLRQDETNMNSMSSSIEQLKLQLSHELEQREVCFQQVSLLKQRNSELEMDMEACRVREAEMLLFTQQLTDKNVRLQSEFSTLEIKVQQLSCEQTLLKRSCKEFERNYQLIEEQLAKEHTLRLEEEQVLARHLAEKTRQCEQLQHQLEDQQGENAVIKRKLESSVKEISKELHQCRKKLEQFEKAERSTNSHSSSNSSLNAIETQVESSFSSPLPEHSTNLHINESDHQIIQPDGALDRQVLINHIIKLQRQSAKKSEKLDFLEEHVKTLLAELQRKSRILQAYMIRQPAGALTSNTMDDNKAELAKFTGVMASMYGSQVQDTTLTLELSLDINRKLQAILEDTLLKNITLKESVDTLGTEIDRLNKLLKTN